jgi:hypothetical protein
MGPELSIGSMLAVPSTHPVIACQGPLTLRDTPDYLPQQFCER